MGARATWIAGTLVALGTVASFAVAIRVTTRRFAHTRLPRGADVVHVEVVARQFAWEVRHPGGDGVLGTRDDVMRADELRVPSGRRVVVHLKTRDVVHGLSLPDYGVHHDALPGRDSPFWFQAGGVGESVMLCSQLCGVGHVAMQGRVLVMSPPDWLRWNATSR